MILYSLVAVLAAGLTLPVDNHYENKGFLYTRQQVLNRLCLVSVFLLLFLVSALRLNVGNDYAKYVEFMHLIRCDAVVPTEFGFNWVVKILYGISGFENYLLVCRVCICDHLPVFKGDLSAGGFVPVQLFPVYGIGILFPDL